MAEHKEKFDMLLAGGLKQHKENVPAEFTDNVMELIEKRQILAKIALLDRIVFAAYVLAGIIILAVISIYSDVIASQIKSLGNLIGSITHNKIDIFSSQFWSILIVAAGLLWFYISELWADESWG
jgi:hypothetical protein